MNSLKRNFIVLTIAAIVYYFLFDFLRVVEFDTPSFVGGARLLFGLDGALDFQSRITKPLVLLLPGFLEWAVGLHPKFTFLAQNLFCFYLTGHFIYRIGMIIFQTDRTAFLMMLVYITAPPFLVFSLFITADMVGWAFGVYLVYFVLQYFKGGRNAWKKALIFGIIAGLGVLSKESAIVGVLFFGAYILVGRRVVLRKMQLLGIAGLSFLVCAGIGSILVYLFFGDSTFARVAESHEATADDGFRWAQLKQIVRVLDLHWFFFVASGAALWRMLKTKAAIPLSIQASMITIILIALLIPIWPYILDRVMFMAAPFLVILIGVCLHNMRRGTVFTSMNAIVNIIITYFIYKFEVQGLLPIIYGTFLLIYVANLYLSFQDEIKPIIPHEETF